MTCSNCTTPINKPHATSEKSSDKPRIVEIKRSYAKQDLEANLAALFLPDVRPVPVWKEFGGRQLTPLEHSSCVKEAQALREWVVKFFGLVAGDKLVHRVWQGRKGRPAGAPAGRVDDYGYLITWAQGKARKNHHLIFLLYHGRLPAKGMVIDHINGNTLDNRIENIREVSYQGNSLNRVDNDDSLPHGITREAHSNGKFYLHAQIAIPVHLRIPGKPRKRHKRIPVNPWTIGGEQQKRAQDELGAISVLEAWWGAQRQELYGVPA